jgi:4-carboxymuconolactone decarboxylase
MTEKSLLGGHFSERLPPLSPEHMSPAQREAADAFAAGRGYAIHGPFSVMLRSPEVMLRAKAMGDYLRFRNVLSKAISEMVILVTARHWTQQFEWQHHYPYALEAGLDRHKADAIGEGRRPDELTPEEAAAYDFAIELHNQKRVSDTTFARAKTAFGEAGIIDLTGICGYYTLLAMMMNVARTKLAPGEPDPLVRFPE